MSTIEDTKNLIDVDESALEAEELDVNEVFDALYESVAPGAIVIYDRNRPSTAVLVSLASMGTEFYVSKWNSEAGRFSRLLFTPLGRRDDDIVLGSHYHSYEAGFSVPIKDAVARRVARRHMVNVDQGPEDVSRYNANGFSNYMDSLTEQLHEIANENDWCDEFDNLMDGLGLEPRQKDYSTAVSVSVEIEIDGSRAVDEAISDLIDAGASVGTVRANVDVTVDVHWTGLAGCEEDYVTSDSVHDAVYDALYGTTIVDIDDWEIIDTQEC